MKSAFYAPAVAIFAMLSALTAQAIAAEQVAVANVELMNADGESIGTVAIFNEEGGAVVEYNLHSIPPGPHGFHMHSIGLCEPPFTSSGGHFNPDGKRHPQHAGAMSNLHVPESGAVQGKIRLDWSFDDMSEHLFDEDGSAIVIHAGPDDYFSEPSGNAGPRFACGLIEAA